ncbi:MAG TPA: diacylglycerol kinase family protein [Armatimonadota bacterium]|jgi:YegS/Rv2252/BmrU family lipid kinase
MKERFLVIANPKAAAGRAQRRWETLLDGLRGQGIEVDCAFTEYPGHAVTLAREACGRYTTLVAAGGDGTVNEVASGILLSAAPDVTLGVIPLGTGNDVAQLQGITSMEEAIQALVSGETRRIDVIEARCRQGDAPAVRYALLYASVGFASELLKYTTPLIKRIFGPRYCYSIGFFRALFRFHSPMMQISAGDRHFAGRMFFAGAGNAEYAGGGTMRLSPGAKMDDGLLNITLVPELSRLEIIRCFPKLLAGTHDTIPSVSYFTAPALTVDADPAMAVAVDGDIFGETPVEFRVRPGALALHVPAPAMITRPSTVIS